MSAVAEAIERRADLDERHTRMAAAIIDAMDGAAAADAADRKAWLDYAGELIAAVDAGDPVEALIEAGYRHLLFSRNQATKDDAPPESPEQFEEMVVLRSPADIRGRLT